MSENPKINVANVVELNDRPKNGVEERRFNKESQQYTEIPNRAELRRIIFNILERGSDDDKKRVHKALTLLDFNPDHQQIIRECLKENNDRAALSNKKVVYYD